MKAEGVVPTERKDWQSLLSSPISYPPQCSSSYCSNVDQCSVESMTKGLDEKKSDNQSEKNKTTTTDVRTTTKKNEWGYDYVPSFSPCLLVNKSLHGFALTVAIERAKSLARARRKCSSLLLHVATAQDTLVTSISQALSPAASNSGMNKSSASTVSILTSDHEYYIMALHQTLEQWSKQQQGESVFLKSNICKNLEDGTELEQEQSRTNWSFYSEYSSIKDSCQKAHLDVKRCKRRYVKQLREVQKELDTYQQKRQQQQQMNQELDCPSSVSEQCAASFYETDDNNSRESTLSTCGAIGSASMRKSVVGGSHVSSSASKGEYSSKALWSALKELQERQDIYVLKRNEEMSYIERASEKEKSALDVMEKMEHERIYFFLDILEQLLRSSITTTEKALDCHFFHDQSHESVDIKAIPQDVSVGQTVVSSSKGGEDSKWSPKSLTTVRRFTQTDATSTDTSAIASNSMDSDEIALPPSPRQRCNTAPATSFSKLELTGSSPQASPVPSEIVAATPQNENFEATITGSNAPTPSIAIPSLSVTSSFDEHDGSSSSSVVGKSMHSISAAIRKSTTPARSLQSSAFKMSKTVGSATTSNSGNINSPAVSQSIALHLPEEAGILRDKVLEQVSIRQKRLVQTKALLQLVDALIDAFDGYASTLRGRLAHEGYSMLSNIKTSNNSPTKSIMSVASPSNTTRRSSSPIPTSKDSYNRRRSSINSMNAIANSILSPSSPRPSSSSISNTFLKQETEAATAAAAAAVENDGNNNNINADASSSSTTTAYDTMSLFSSPAAKGSGIGEPLSQAIRSVEGPNVIKRWNFTLETIAQTVHACATFSQSLKQIRSQTLTKYLLTLQKDFHSFRESEDIRWKHLTEAAQNEGKAKSRLMQTTLELQKATEKAQALEKETSNKKSDQIAVDMNPTMRKALGNMFSILPGGGEDAMTKLLSLKQRIEIAKVTQLDLEAKCKTDKELLQKASRAKFQSFTSYTAAARALEITFDKEEQSGWTTLVDVSKNIRQNLFSYLTRRQSAIENSMSVLDIPRKGPPSNEEKDDEHNTKCQGSRSMEEGEFEGVEVGLSFGASNKSLDLEKRASTESNNDDEEKEKEGNDDIRESERNILDDTGENSNYHRYQHLIDSDMNVWSKNLYTKLEQHRQRSYDAKLIGSTKDDVNLSSMVEGGILDGKTKNVIMLAGRFLITERDADSSSRNFADEEPKTEGTGEDLKTGDSKKSQQDSALPEKTNEDNVSTPDKVQLNNDKTDPSGTLTALQKKTDDSDAESADNDNSEKDASKEKIRSFCRMCIYDWSTAQTLLKNILNNDADDDALSFTIEEFNKLARQLHLDIRDDATAMIEAAADEKSSLVSSFTKSQETNVFLQHFWNNAEDIDGSNENESKIPPTIIQSFSCAYWPNKDDGESSLSPLLHGRMFCTSQKMYFVGWGGKKIILLWNQVASVHKDTTVSGMVDNALRLEMKSRSGTGSASPDDSTTNGTIDTNSNISSYFFGSFAFRDKAYDLLHQLVSVSHSLQTLQIGTPSTDIEGSSASTVDDSKGKDVVGDNNGKARGEPPKPVIELKPVPPDPVIKKMDPLITKKVADMTVDTYYKHIWSEGRSEEGGSSSDVKAFYKPWLEETGNHEVTITDWENGSFVNSWCGETYNQRRVVTFKYTRTSHLYVGPPVADVTQTHYCRVERQHKDGPADKCVLAMTVKMEGIPYADTFLVQIRWVGRRLGHGPFIITNRTDLQLDAGVFIEFKKSSMFASKIRSGTIDESKPTHVDLLAKIEKRLSLVRSSEKVVTATETLERVQGIVVPPDTVTSLEEKLAEEETEVLVEEAIAETRRVSERPLSMQERVSKILNNMGSAVMDPVSHPFAFVSIACLGFFSLRYLFTISTQSSQTVEGVTQARIDEIILRMDSLSSDVKELKQDMEKILKLLCKR